MNKYFVQVVNGSWIASAGHAIFLHSGKDHVLTETLFKAAVLAVTFSHTDVN